MPHQMNSPWSAGLKGDPSKTGRVLITLVIKTGSICCHERTHSCVKKGGTVEQETKPIPSLCLVLPGIWRWNGLFYVDESRREFFRSAFLTQVILQTLNQLEYQEKESDSRKKYFKLIGGIRKNGAGSCLEGKEIPCNWSERC
jgi:hypothetical protein